MKTKRGSKSVNKKSSKYKQMDFDDPDSDDGDDILKNNIQDDSGDDEEMGGDFGKYQASLRSALNSGNGKRKFQPSEMRTEAAKVSSEFAFSKGYQDGKKSMSMEAMVNTLKRSNKEKNFELVKRKIKEKAGKKKEMKTLDAPAEKIVTNKITRTVLYDNVKKDVSKWNSIVYHNRVADQLVFPLNSGNKLPKLTAKDVMDDFVPQNPLEEEMAKLLHGEDYLKRKKEEMQAKDSATVDTEQYMLSVEEALAQHSELARLRALQSYEMAKARRKNKIKSKQYHRLLRREKIRKQLKDFEELQQKDPEAALEKLNELNLARIKERMNLKHRNTSKWSKMQAARAKYSKESRLALTEQLKISREADEVRDFMVNEEELNVEVSHGGEDLPQYLQAPTINQLSAEVNSMESIRKDRNSVPKSVDPKNFLKICKKLQYEKFDATNMDNGELDQDSENEDQRELIAEAFEDDDVVSEFQNKKQEIIDDSTPKDINLSLPGWGEWGGKDIRPNLRKRNRFLKKAKPPPPRKDARLAHVIINEDATAKLKEHQVRQLPFPFKRVKDFEKIIRAPVGRTWIPEQSMKSLTAPKVITRLGAVIKPISEDLLVNRKSKSTKKFFVPNSILQLTKSQKT